MFLTRVTGIKGGQVTPLDNLPALSSAGSTWPGFLLEAHILPECREEFGWSWHSTHVGVCLTPSEICISGAAGNGRFRVYPGNVFIFPRKCDHTNFHISANYNFVVVEVGSERLQRLIHEHTRTVDDCLTPQLYISDPCIAGLISNMRAEVEAGCPSDPLYGESLSMALAAYVASRYSASAGAPHVPNHRFSRAQIQQLLDYIHAHLGMSFSLFELAEIVHLSPRQFSRLFRNTFGTSPHRYVLDKRISQAKELLAARRLPIVDISARLGFASQSHFTDVFRKATGIPPKRYQQAH